MRGWPPGTVALPLWNTGVWLRCSYMSSHRIIVDALKLAQSLVGQNLRPATDAATVLRLRELFHSPSVRAALERSSDSLPAFALREVMGALSDQSQTQGETIARVRTVLDDPQLNEVFGFPQKRWIRYRLRRNL
jgi:hypothetical protein